MQPIPEAVAWAERADAWASQPEDNSGRGQELNRWSESAAAGRPAFPADGVGWRTETAEWRATDQTARWRQTTEWRSTSGTHGYRTTTEAWQTGAGAEGFTPPVEPPGNGRQPLAISGAAWSGSESAADGDEPTRTWQNSDGAGNTSWHRVSGSPPPGTEPKPAWQQFTEQPSSGAPWPASGAAPWQSSSPGAPWQPSAPSWQSTDRPSATPSPSWQSLVEQPDQSRPSWNTTGPVPTINGTTVPDQGARSAPFDEGRHLVREDDRDRWRREYGDESRPGGRRRASDAGSRTSSGTGWSTRSDADNWAGHADTGSMQMFDASALAAASEAPSWRTPDDPGTDWRNRTSGDWRDDQSRPSWRDDPEAARNSTSPPSWRTDPGAPRHVSAAPAWNTDDPNAAPGTSGAPGAPAPWSGASPNGPTSWNGADSPAGPTSWNSSGSPGSWNTDQSGRRRISDDEGPSWRRDPADSPRVNGAASGGWQRDDDRREQPPATGGPRAIGWRPEEPPAESWRANPSETGSWRDPQQPGPASWRDAQRGAPGETGSWRDPQPSDTGSWRGTPTETGSWRDTQPPGPSDNGSWRDAQPSGPADAGSWRDAQRGTPGETGSWRTAPGGSPAAQPPGPADAGNWRGGPSETGSWRDPQRGNPGDTGSWRDRTAPAAPGDWRDPQRGNPGDTGSWRDNGQRPAQGSNDSGSWGDNGQRPSPSETGSWRRDEPQNYAGNGQRPPGDWRDPQQGAPGDTGSWRDPQRGNPGDTGSWRDNGQRSAPAPGETGSWRRDDAPPGRPGPQSAPPARRGDDSWRRDLAPTDPTADGASGGDPVTGGWKRDADTGQWYRNEAIAESMERRISPGAPDDRGPGPGGPGQGGPWPGGPGQGATGPGGPGPSPGDGGWRDARRAGPGDTGSWRDDGRRTRPGDTGSWRDGPPSEGGRRRIDPEDWSRGEPPRAVETRAIESRAAIEGRPAIESGPDRGEGRPDGRAARDDGRSVRRAGEDRPEWRSDPRFRDDDDVTQTWRRDDVDAPRRRGRDDDDDTRTIGRRGDEPSGETRGARAIGWRGDEPPGDGAGGGRTPNAVGRARPLNPNRRRGDDPGSTGTRMSRADDPGTTATRMSRGDETVGPEVWGREPGTRTNGNWPADSRDMDWRDQLRGETVGSVGDAVTEIRRVEPDWLQAERESTGRTTAIYREGATSTDWRKELGSGSDLAEGEARRYNTQDFVPFRGTGSASVAAAPVSPNVEAMPPPAQREEWPPRSASVDEDTSWPPRRAGLADGPPRRAGDGVDEDTSWPPRRVGGASSTGAYERRPVGGGLATAVRPTSLLEPDEEEIEEDTGGPFAAVGYTAGWYGVPVVLFLLYYLVVLNGDEKAHALDTLAGAAPQFGLSLVLSMGVAVGLRWASGSWKAVSVGLAAAVMGGGLATVLTSAITGNSLS